MRRMWATHWGGLALDICLWPHVNQRCNLQHAYSWEKRLVGDALLMLPSIKHRNKIWVALHLQYNSYRSDVLGIILTCKSPRALKGNVASTQTICCTSSFSLSRNNSSLVGGRPKPSLLIQYIPVARRALVS